MLLLLLLQLQLLLRLIDPQRFRRLRKNVFDFFEIFGKVHITWLGPRLEWYTEKKSPAFNIDVIESKPMCTYAAYNYNLIVDIFEYTILSLSGEQMVIRSEEIQLIFIFFQVQPELNFSP